MINVLCHSAAMVEIQYDVALRFSQVVMQNRSIPSVGQELDQVKLQVQ